MLSFIGEPQFFGYGCSNREFIAPVGPWQEGRPDVVIPANAFSCTDAKIRNMTDNPYQSPTTNSQRTMVGHSRFALAFVVILIVSGIIWWLLYPGFK
jgi:hypothetical protein